MKRLIFSLAWLLVSLSTFAQMFEGTVLRVLDGDTYDVEVNGTKLRCRLMNVDAPEKDGSGRYGVKTKTKQMMATLLKGQPTESYLCNNMK